MLLDVNKIKKRSVSSMEGFSYTSPMFILAPRKLPHRQVRSVGSLEVKEEDFSL